MKILWKQGLYNGLHETLQFLQGLSSKKYKMPWKQGLYKDFCKNLGYSKIFKKTLGLSQGI